MRPALNSLATLKQLCLPAHYRHASSLAVLPVTRFDNPNPQIYPKPTPSPSPTPRLYRSEILRLLHPVSRLLKEDRSQLALDFVVQRLDHCSYQHIPKHFLYEALVPLFARHRDWSSVDVLLGFIKRDGFVVSSAIQSALLPRLWSSSSEVGLKEFNEMMLQGGVPPDEGVLCSFISRASKGGTAPAVIEEMLQAYGKAAGPRWKPTYQVASTMMAVYVKANEPEGLVRWARHSEAYIRSREAQRPRLKDKLLKASAAERPLSRFRFHQLADIAARQTIVDPSKAYKLADFLQYSKPDLTGKRRFKYSLDNYAYNILIAANIRTFDFAGAQKHYTELTNPITRSHPDTYTFASMFKAHEMLQQYSKPWRQLVETKFGPPPRILFKHLMTWNLLKRSNRRRVFVPARAHLLTTSLLRVILRTLVTLKDYAAAIVAMESFEAYQVNADVATCKVIWHRLADQLVRRMRKKRLIHGVQLRPLGKSISRKRYTNIPTVFERREHWPVKMLDDHARWESRYTTQLKGNELSSTEDVHLVINNSELCRRVTERLFKVVCKDLQVGLGTLAEWRLEIASLVSRGETAIAKGYINRVKALLRRGIVLEDCDLEEQYVKGEEIFRGVLEKARKDMIPKNLILPLAATSTAVTL